MADEFTRSTHIQIYEAGKCWAQFRTCLARFAFERMVEDEIEAAINKNAHVRCRRIVKRAKTLAVHN